MKLPVPAMQLPLRFDPDRLADEVACLDAGGWQPHAGEGGDDFVLPLVCAGGDPAGYRAAGPVKPTRNLASCPCLMQVLARLDVVLGRTLLVKAACRPGLPRRVDTSYYGVDRMRIHVPIVTSPDFRFLCEGIEVPLAAGECWALDTWRQHRLMSVSEKENVYLTIDTVGSRAFHELFGSGRIPGRPSGNWQPEFVAMAQQPVALRFESISAPPVMTPWELREHIGLLVTDARPHPKLVAVRKALLEFVAQWHALWARYGTDARGHAAYRSVLKNLERSLEHQIDELRLGNNVAFARALQDVVLERALPDR